MSIVQQIQRSARRYGVDPRAAIAVARQEGGLNPGAVGDQGTSYGPFQLHVGGALPAGRGAGWANSPAGIDYAVRQMSQSGARGKRGTLAIEAIVRNFERPANPGREIARANAAYGSVPAASGWLDAPAPKGVSPQDMGGSRGRSLASALLKYAQSGGQDITPILKAQHREVAPGGFTDPHGTLHPPKGNVGPIGSVLAAAHTQIGKPYVFGSGPDTKSFDCSDLVQWAYKQIGVDIPRTTYDQIKVGQPVGWNQLRPGDLVFSNKGEHVVMYVGGGRVIAAPHTGTVVQYQPLARFKSGFVGARRIVQ